MFLSGAIPLAIFFALSAQRRRWLWGVAAVVLSAATWQRSRAGAPSVSAR